MSKTAVGLFESAGVADQVVRDLDAAAFPVKKIRIVKEPLDMAVTDVTQIPHTDFEVGLGRDLKSIGASEADANAYVLAVRRGGTLVFATGSDAEVDNAARIMNRHGAIGVEELVGESYRSAARSKARARICRARPIHSRWASTSTQTGRVRSIGRWRAHVCVVGPRKSRGCRETRSPRQSRGRAGLKRLTISARSSPCGSALPGPCGPSPSDPRCDTGRRSATARGGRRRCTGAAVRWRYSRRTAPGLPP